MSQKRKIILISVFIFVIAVLLGVYFYTKNKNATDPNASFIEKYNPFGKSDKVVNEGGETDPKTDPSTITSPIVENSRFNKITDFAVAGATFFEDTREEKLVSSLKYVERATGHVYQMYLDTKVVGKISNSTIPGVYEAIFDGSAKSVIYRYASSDNNSITSFLATLGGKSSFLNSNILGISTSPDKSKFFSIVKNVNGVTGVIKSFSETKTNQVFTSPFSEWIPEWVTEQSVYLTTKPSYFVEGSVFSLNITNGTLSKLIGGIPGLTTLSNKSGSSILYGASLESGPRLNVFNIKDHMSTDLDKYGLPEKCVWSGDNIHIYCAVPNTIVGVQYPDSWYQGLVSFDDFFVKINTVTKESSTLANSKNEVPLDGTNLFLNKDESILFFINKKDSTLWSLDL